MSTFADVTKVFLVALTIVLLLVPQALAAQSVKSRTNLLSPEAISIARAKIAAGDPDATAYLQGVLKKAEVWMKYSDEELRVKVPPASVPRAFDVHFDQCPLHSEEIKKFGSYPWVIDLDKPYKVICPVGGEEYPSNDFDPTHPGSPYRVSTEPFVDNGWGWQSPDSDQKYWFVAYYTHWLWYKYLAPGTAALAEAYVLTGDLTYAHKAIVLLDRIAEEYPKMDYVKQSRYGTEIQKGSYQGRVVNHIWETGLVTDLARAYDYVFPAINDEEVQRHIEENILEVAAESIYTTDGKIQGNFGMHQKALATIAIVLDNADTEKYLDYVLNVTGQGSWIYEGMLTGLHNLLYQDGAPLESSPGYNSLWLANFREIAELLLQRGIDLYSQEPKLQRLFDYPLRLSMLGKFTPNVGDVGSVRSSGHVGWSSENYETAFRRYGDLAYARVLAQSGGISTSVYDEPIEEQALALVQEASVEANLVSDNMPGYGLAMLRTGEGEKGTALSLYYGQSGGHGHFDRLNIELFAKGQRISPDLGYGEYMTGYHKKLYGWTKHTISHNTVLVDRERQTSTDGGRLQAFASSPAVQYVDASAEEAYSGIVERYQRSVALIEAPDNDAYVLDVFRVEGGSQHDYSFHGPDGSFSTSGAGPFTVQEQGTVAGENVPFGYLYDAPNMEAPGYSGTYNSYTGSGFSYLKNVAKAQVDGVWSAQWMTYDNPDVGLRATFVAEPGTTAILADGEPPQNKDGNPPTLKYVLLEKKAAQQTALGSVFTTIIEPFTNQPFIKDVSRLALASGEDNGAEAPVALKVEHSKGTDYVLQSLGGTALTAGDVHFQGRLGVVARGKQGELRYANLVGGTILSQGDVTISAPSAYTGTITAVDFEQGTVTIQANEGAPAFPAGEVLSGQRVMFSNEEHATEYVIESVRSLGEGVYQLVLQDGDFLTAVGELSWARSRGSRGFLGAKTPLQLGSYYNGQHIVNPANGAQRMITSFGGTIFLEGNAEGFSSGDEFRIYDVGIGDQVEIVGNVYVSGENGEYTVVSNIPAKVTIGGRAFAVEPGQGR